MMPIAARFATKTCVYNSVLAVSLKVSASTSRADSGGETGRQKLLAFASAFCAEAS